MRSLPEHEEFEVRSAIEQAASRHRVAAVAGCDRQSTPINGGSAASFYSLTSTKPRNLSWSGSLDTVIDENSADPFLGPLSPKLFLGGVSWYTNDRDILKKFAPFGLRYVELPSRTTFNDNTTPAAASLGFAYLIFENGQCVRRLLDACNTSANLRSSSTVFSGRQYQSAEAYGSGSKCWSSSVGACEKRMQRRNCFYTDLPSAHGSKPVEVIPWTLNDNNYFRPCVIPPLDPKRTVFIGNLHGTVKARELASLVEQIFQCSVEYAGIDVDRYKYPIGSGRVTFQRGADFSAAIDMGFVDVRTPRFSKRIQIDPYLEDMSCSQCKVNNGKFFCRTCFEYFCANCWALAHRQDYTFQHKPLTRKQKTDNANGNQTSVTNARR